jgi:hypothetical protein
MSFPLPPFGTNQQKLVKKGVNNRVKSRKLARGRDECNSILKKGRGRFRFDSTTTHTMGTDAKGKGEKKLIKL